MLSISIPQEVAAFSARVEAQRQSAKEARVAVGDACNRLCQVHDERVSSTIEQAKTDMRKVSQRQMPLHKVKEAVRNMVSEVESELRN